MPNPVKLNFYFLTFGTILALSQNETVSQNETMQVSYQNEFEFKPQIFSLARILLILRYARPVPNGYNKMACKISAKLNYPFWRSASLFKTV